jgi:3-methyladenine DNA glycosylase Mpg
MPDATFCKGRRRFVVHLEDVAVLAGSEQVIGIERLRDLARGPGRLTAALRVDGRLDGLDLCRESPLWLGRGHHESVEIEQSIRIGISRDANRLLRFYLRDSRGKVLWRGGFYQDLL